MVEKDLEKYCQCYTANDCDTCLLIKEYRAWLEGGGDSE